jgi:hypothetical protein
MLHHNQLDESFSPFSLEFNNSLLHVKFAVDVVVPDQIFSEFVTLFLSSLQQ